ncbi:MAG: recombinase RecT [Sphaerochaeta sp.]|jgi:recombination protein RecT|nr:recombinase RecT [Sphaerochaeta sp.]
MSTNQANATRTVNQQGIIKQQANAAAVRKQPQTLKDFVIAMQDQIAKALPSVITAERFTRIALTALSSNPKLAECDRNSFLGGLMQAAQLGLEPNTPLGQAYLIPFKNNKKGITECQFQIGYKGLIDLCYRSGEMTSVYAHVVYEHDEFEYEYGLDQKLVHKPARTNRGNPVFYYAVWKLKNGGYGFSVWSVEDVEAHARKYSQAYKSQYDSPWKSEFDEMAKKTVLKATLKYAPIKTDFIIDATQKDEAVLITDKDLAIHAEYETVDEGFQDQPQPIAEGELTDEQAAQLELDKVPFGDQQ